MNRSTMIAATVLLSVIATNEAGAQWNVARWGTDRQHAYTTFGLDPAFVSTVGVGQVVSVFGRDVQLTGDAGVAAAKLDASDFRVRLGAQGSVLRWRSVQVTGSATFITRGTENAVYRGLNFGADLGATAGVYRHRWFAAGEVGKDKAIVTHIAHTTWYRNNVYRDAKDGWYVDAGGTVRYGVTTGIAIGRTELAARAGWQRTEHWGKLASPMYASMGVGLGI